MTIAERRAAIVALKAAEPWLTGAEIAARVGASKHQVYVALNPEGEKRRRARQIADFKSPNPRGHCVTGPRRTP